MYLTKSVAQISGPPVSRVARSRSGVAAITVGVYFTAYTHTNKHTQTHTCTHTYTHTNTSKHKKTNTHKHKIHKHTNTHIHTQIYTHLLYLRAKFPSGNDI